MINLEENKFLTSLEEENMFLTSLEEENKFLTSLSDWSKFKEIKEFPISYFRKHKDTIPWSYVAYNRKLTDDFIKEFFSYLKDYMACVLSKSKISPEYLLELTQNNHIQYAWHSVARYQKLTNEYIDKYQTNLDWGLLTKYQKVSSELLKKYAFKFKDKWIWNEISIHQDLSDDFIREYKDKLYFVNLEKYQTLSEDIMEEFEKQFDWKSISLNQNLSFDFIKRHINKLDKKILLKNVKIPKGKRERVQKIISNYEDLL